MNRYKLIRIVLVVSGAATVVRGADSALPTFLDVTEQAGIAFKHSYGDEHLTNIVEGTGPGCGFLDYDGDGHLDIYLINGSWRRDVNDNLGRKFRGKLSNKLYRNNGDGTFRDVTEKAGVGDQGYGMAISAADYDNDGDLDLYVLNYGPNVLYQNNGDGTFTDVTEASGLGDPMWSLSAPWVDYDNDGDLDVYVANYLYYDAGEFRDFYPAAGYPGPLSYKAQPDHLYRNDGNGKFTDVTTEAGIIFPNGRAMSAAAADLNNDGLVDVFVTNDASPNAYWVNTGKGTFNEKAMEFGVAFGEGGQSASSMGPFVGDVDRNGYLDLYIPDMGYSCLLVNRNNFFEDITAPSNLAVVAGQYTGWGGILFDYDNDGFLDVFCANGNAHHEYTEEDILLHNNGRGRFRDVARESGAYFATKRVGRGSACADYDNDGDLDLLVMNLNGPATLLRNEGGNKRNWLKVVPRLQPSNSIALCARVTVKVDGNELIEETLGINGYLSRSDPRAHFGLGEATQALVEVRWPDGTRSRHENVRVNQILEVKQPKTQAAGTPSQTRSVSAHEAQ